ncbi:hypothetical protein FQ192_10640 [Pseudomonas sp. ANT_J12]|uniref:hypothetical protein n=1 Tax=Pseudomonas sp. ANT_J12 TaxID=2597351 RepID=UPI0011F0C5FA|nr:hypothetical protein [Pseudomonas sp. ANT_J12]KAA0995487.1 hypothetical protein FQ192_10640 [Pseudomonas sp. ANT_J12]
MTDLFTDAHPEWWASGKQPEGRNVFSMIVGKTYNTKNGSVVTIEHDKGDYQYPFFGTIIGADGKTDRLAYYAINGSYDLHSDSGYSIASEA